MNTPKQRLARSRNAYKMGKMNQAKTSPEQLAMVRDWERRHPEQAQARKNAWAQSPNGRAWLKANQKKKNEARDAWRKRKREAQKISK